MPSTAFRRRSDNVAAVRSRCRRKSARGGEDAAGSSELGSASPDLSNDNVALVIEGAEDPAERLGKVEQTGDFVGDEEDTGALRKARKDAELTVPVDSVRAYLKQIGKVALLNAEEEVELATRIEAGLYAAERVGGVEDVTAKLAPQLRRDLRWVVRDGERAKNHLLEANLRLVVSLAKRYTGRGWYSWI